MAAGSIAVIGDLMLDVFETGSVSRISPEAPVLVVLNPVATSTLGGAANTAANVDRLGADVALAGVLGDDEPGSVCRRLIAARGIGDLSVSSAEVVTTVKTRYLASGQQIVRIDHERPVPATAAQRLAEVAAALPNDTRGVVLSDYDKGSVDERVAATAIARARALGVPVVVDSKKTAVDLFRGCTVIAPNHHEAARMTGTADPATAASLIAAATGSAVLVTLGADGMLLLESGEVTRIASRAREVSDVVGAGDTVTAALAVALAEGRTLQDAARWANMAAAVSVSHHGTYAVSAAEVDAYEAATAA